MFVPYPILKILGLSGTLNNYLWIVGGGEGGVGRGGAEQLIRYRD